MKSKHIVTSLAKNGNAKDKTTLQVALPQLLAVSVKNILLIGFGMTMGFPTILIPNLSGDNPNEMISLTADQISWTSSIMLICVPLGCLFSGPVTQPIGRKRAMQLVNFPFIIFWLLFKYATQVWHIYLALALSGFTGGLLEAPVLTYVAEITQPHLRGMLSATSSLSINLGILLQFLLGTFLPWRQVALICCILPLFAFVCLFIIPESPHWLIMNKRHEEARKSLAWLRGWTTVEAIEEEYKDIYHRGYHSEAEEEDNKESLVERMNRICHLFSQKSFLWPFAIVSFVFFLQHFSGVTTLQTYAVQIFATLQTPIDKFYATIILGVVEFLGCLACVCLIGFVGKRRLTFFSLVSAGLCFLVVATHAYCSGITELIIRNVNATQPMNGTSPTNNDLSDALMTYNWIPTSFLIASAFLTHCGVRILPWILIGEVYPREIRAAASGVSGTSGYIFGFAANKLFYWMIKVLTLPGTFWFYSGISLIGTITLYFILPETEGKTLTEITNHFDGISKMDNKVKRKDKVLIGQTNPAFDGKGTIEQNKEDMESKL